MYFWCFLTHPCSLHFHPSSLPPRIFRYALRYDQARLDKFLATFFKRYDRNGDGRIDQEELSSLLSDMGESQLGNEGINHADMDANQVRP